MRVEGGRAATADGVHPGPSVVQLEQVHRPLVAQGVQELLERLQDTQTPCTHHRLLRSPSTREERREPRQVRGPHVGAHVQVLLGEPTES